MKKTLVGIALVVAALSMTACSMEKPVEGYVSAKQMVPAQDVVENVCTGTPEVCTESTSSIPASYSFKVVNMNTDTDKPQELSTPVSEADYNTYIIGDYYSTDPGNSRITKK